MFYFSWWFLFLLHFLSLLFIPLCFSSSPLTLLYLFIYLSFFCETPCSSGVKRCRRNKLYNYFVHWGMLRRPSSTLRSSDETSKSPFSHNYRSCSLLRHALSSSGMKVGPPWWLEVRWEVLYLTLWTVFSTRTGAITHLFKNLLDWIRLGRSPQKAFVFVFSVGKTWKVITFEQIKSDFFIATLAREQHYETRGGISFMSPLCAAVFN